MILIGYKASNTQSIKLISNSITDPLSLTPYNPLFLSGHPFGPAPQRLKERKKARVLVRTCVSMYV